MFKIGRIVTGDQIHDAGHRATLIGKRVLRPRSFAGHENGRPRAQVADMTVATYPFKWTFGHSSRRFFEPFVELCRVATHVRGQIAPSSIFGRSATKRAATRFGLLRFRHLAPWRTEGRSSPRRPSHPERVLQPRWAGANGDRWAKRICHLVHHPQTHGPWMDQAARIHW
jgi:hypothetical protein